MVVAARRTNDSLDWMTLKVAQIWCKFKVGLPNWHFKLNRGEEVNILLG